MDTQLSSAVATMVAMAEGSHDDLLSYAEIAEYVATKGVTLTVSTLRAYRTTGRFPGPDDTKYARVPRWRRSTVDEWLAARPGQGARTDLAQPEPKGELS